MRKLILFLVVVMALASCAPKLTEKVEVAFPNGQPQIVKKYDKSGNCVYETTYYESGQVRFEGGMKNGKMDGEWFSYFPDGRMQSKGFYENGARMGEGTAWRPNGNLYYEGHYQNGKHCGKWKWYDEQGNLIREEDYGE